MTKYILMNLGNPEACYIDNGLDAVRESLKFFFENSFDEILEDDDERLEDSFKYISKSRFNSVPNMTFEKLQEELYDEFNWGLVELDNRGELVEKVLAQDNYIKREILEKYIDESIAELEKS